MAAPRRDRNRAPVPLADGAPPRVAALTVYANVDADRLTTSRDAEERRRTRGPWTDGMVFGPAGIKIGKQKYKQRVSARGWGDKNRCGSAPVGPPRGAPDIYYFLKTFLQLQ